MIVYYQAAQNPDQIDLEAAFKARHLLLSPLQLLGARYFFEEARLP